MRPQEQTPSEDRLLDLIAGSENPKQILKIACDVILKILDWYQLFGEWPTEEELPELLTA